MEQRNKPSLPLKFVPIIPPFDILQKRWEHSNHNTINIGIPKEGKQGMTTIKK